MKSERLPASNIEELSIYELASEFFLELQLQNWTDASIYTCKWHIQRFLKFLSEKSIDKSEELTREILREYQLGLILNPNSRGKRFSPSTINRYMTSVMGFIRFLKELDYLNIPSDPEQGITYAKEATKLPRDILTKEEMVRLIEAPNVSTVIGYRDRTIMELLYTTAIRRNECRFLKVQDVNFHDHLLRVFGKGQKERMAPIGRIALTFLEGYISNVRPLLAADSHEDHLFLSARGCRLSKNVMGEFIAKYAKWVRIAKRVTPHTFRHTCATLMLRNRADVRYIQMLLGHESLVSTQIYTHVSAVDLKEILEKYHPREKD